VNRNLTDVVVGAATVALIAIATRWLSDAKGAASPTPRNGANFYRLKWQIRAVSYLAAAFFLFLSIVAFRRDATISEWTIDSCSCH
jgi:multisubunit Na+/H+ antiporter MnhB subunit